MTTWTKEESMQIASTILEQIGGNQFRMMTGAKGFVALDGGLLFRLNARSAKGVTHVRIVLDPSDTYTVTFYGQKSTGGEVVYDSTYCDQLRGLFEDVTGLRTSMTATYGGR